MSLGSIERQALDDIDFPIRASGKGGRKRWLHYPIRAEIGIGKTLRGEHSL